MEKIIYDNNIDNWVDIELFKCLNIENSKSFFLFAGAGSGKTRSLVNVLEEVQNTYGEHLRLNRQKIAVITYTNAACDEIIRRLKDSCIFSISTIHSFAWELIKYYVTDIKDWITQKTQKDIIKLEQEEARGRINTQKSIDRRKDINKKQERLERLKTIKKFSYDPNGNNTEKNSLDHSEVISICTYFLQNKPLFQKILLQKYPILLIDESQDTKKELVDAFLNVEMHNENFTIGLFGDIMQRIYSDGKEDLDKIIPDSWSKFDKRMNHRCSKRIIKLINKIRKNVDGKEQLSRIEQEEGYVRLFILSSTSINKMSLEELIQNKMAVITNDELWSNSEGVNVKTLILEHHMAAKRLGFEKLYSALSSVDKYKTGLRDGTLSSIRFFTETILPLIQSHNKNNNFLLSKIVTTKSPLLEEERLKESENQIELLKNVNLIINDLLSLWNDNTPKLIDILMKVQANNLFLIPYPLNIIAEREKENKDIEENKKDDEVEDGLKAITAWDKALNCSFDEIVAYDNYVSENSQFSTHQGVKGLEFDRVLSILDDEDANGFMFKYEKLFEVSPQSATDLKNISDGKETIIDRTKRLFYVICSRAVKSLAIVAYTSNIEKLKEMVIREGWFLENEILFEHDII